MGKGIYVLKIYIFKAHFKLIARETKIISDFAEFFISLVHVKQRNEALQWLAIRAPLDDIYFSTVLIFWRLTQTGLWSIKRI